MSNSKEGWLTKEGKKFKSWKRRWFVLNKTQLNYYKTPGTKLLGTIELSKAIKIDVNDEQSNLFEIFIPNVRTYRLKSDSKEELASWITILKSCIGPRTPPKIPRPVHRYCLDDFDKIDELGVGTFGKVSLVRCKRDGKLYAMKTMTKKLLEEYDQIQAIILERNILFEIKHPFLVSAHFSFQSEDKVFLILDYVSGGNMLERIREEDYFNEDRARLYAAEASLALGYLHKIGYIYRDMKSDNVLIGSDGHIKITDFGLIKGQMFRPNDTTSTFCGTVEYIAPETILEKPYTKDVDWWGLGILLYEMLVGRTPFYDENQIEIYKSIVNDEPYYPARVSEKARSFICKLLKKDPSKRLGFGEDDVEAIKRDPFFDGINWDDVVNKRIEPEWVPGNESVNLELKREFSVSEHEDVTENTQLAFRGFSLINVFQQSPTNE